MLLQNVLVKDKILLAHILEQLLAVMPIRPALGRKPMQLGLIVCVEKKLLGVLRCGIRIIRSQPMPKSTMLDVQMVVILQMD